MAARRERLRSQRSRSATCSRAAMDSACTHKDNALLQQSFGEVVLVLRLVLRLQDSIKNEYFWLVTEPWSHQLCCSQ